MQGDKVCRRKPSPYEHEILREFDSIVVATARRIFSGEAAAMGQEDLQSELRMAVVLSCRKWHADGHKGKPEPAWIQRAVSSRKLNLIRTIKRAQANEPHESGSDEEGDNPLDRVACDLPSPGTVAEAAERRDALAGLVYALREGMTPNAFALLHLRYVEEHSPADIERRVGLPTQGKPGQRVSRKLWRAKKQARELLDALGMTTVDDEEIPGESHPPRAPVELR